MPLDLTNNCNPITGAINLIPNCDALVKKGGLGKGVYIGSVADVDAYTVDPTTKALTTLVMKEGKTLRYMSGKRYKNSSTMGNTQTENGALFQHGITFNAYISTQAEKETLELYAGADDLFIISQLNSGPFEAHGLVGKRGFAEGMTMTSTGGSGTAAADASNQVLTFAGEEDKLPVYVEFGADTAAILGYLDALVDTAEAPAAAA